MPKTILVVEDEKVLLEAIIKKLETKGYHVRSAISGQQGLRILGDKTQPKPDLIWLDFYLSDMDGLGFMGNLVKNPHTESIPVIVVSNSMSDETIQLMSNIGVKKYLLKSDNTLDQILKVVEEILNK